MAGVNVMVGTAAAAGLLGAAIIVLFTEKSVSIPKQKRQIGLKNRAKIKK